MEITSQQYLATSRGVQTTRPSSSYFNPVNPTENSQQVNANEELTPQQKQEQRRNEQAVEQQVRDLSARDREVRAHEAAHVAAGGRYVSGGPSFTYQRGPNGRYYAIGGEVQLDVSSIPANPEATLDKAETIRRAALAPAQPSPQDLQVAANAARMASRARIDIAIQQREQLAEQRNSDDTRGQTGTANGINVADGYGNGGGSGELAAPAEEVFDIVA